MARTWLAALLLAFTAALAGAWSRPAAIAIPSYIAIGGGLADDNDALFKQLLIRNDTDKIVIVPYASADPAEAARRIIDRFKKHRPNARYLVLPDPLKDNASKQLAADWIAHADLVFFTGGDQSRLVPRFVENGRPNSVLSALHDGMRKYATPVAGASAGCAALSNPMFTGGGSESALAGLPATDGEQPNDGDHTDAQPRGVRLGQGLGMVEGVILDSHFLSRGRLGRMIAALEASDLRFGVGVADNRAVSIRGNLYRAIGDAAALVVDVGQLQRDGLSRLNVRLALLSNGDGFVPVTHPSASNPLTGSEHFGQRGEPAPRIEAAAALARDLPAQPDAWGRDVVLNMLRRLAADPATPSGRSASASSWSSPPTSTPGSPAAPASPNPSASWAPAPTCESAHPDQANPPPDGTMAPRPAVPVRETP